MDNLSDSDKTNVDQSEVLPDAKKCFYSEMRPSSISVVLEPDTPSMGGIVSSSPEKSIVSETTSDVTSGLSDTSYSCINNPGIPPSNILKTGNSNSKSEIKNSDMLITATNPIVKGIDSPNDAILGPPNLDASMINIVESSTHLKMSRLQLQGLDETEDSVNKTMQINSVKIKEIQDGPSKEANDFFKCDCGLPAGSNEERILCKHRCIKQEHTAVHDSDKTITQLLNTRIHEYNHVGICGKEQINQVVILSDDDSDLSSVIELISSDDDVKEVVVEKGNESFDNVNIPKDVLNGPHAYKLNRGNLLECGTFFTENFRFNENKYPNYVNTVTIINDDATVVESISNQDKTIKDIPQLNTTMISGNRKETKCNLQNLVGEDSNRISFLKNRMTECYSSQKPIHLDEDNSNLDHLKDSSNSVFLLEDDIFDGKHKNMHTSNKNSSKESNNLSNSDNVESLELRNIDILIDLVNEDQKEGLSPEKPIDLDEYISNVDSATNSDSSVLICKDSIVYDKDKSMHTPNENNVSNENNNLSNNVNDENSEFKNIDILIDLVNEDQKGYSSEKPDLDEDISNVESVTNSGSSDMLCKDIIVHGKDNKIHTPSENNVIRENNNLSNNVNGKISKLKNIDINVIHEEQEKMNQSKVNADSDRCVSKSEYLDNKSNSSNNQTDEYEKGNSTDEFENINMLIDIIDKSNGVSIPTRGEVYSNSPTISVCYAKPLNENYALVHTPSSICNNIENNDSLVEAGNELDHLKNKLSSNQVYKVSNTVNSGVTIEENVVGITIPQTVTPELFFEADLLSTTQNNVIGPRAYPVKNDAHSISMVEEYSVNTKSDSREQEVSCKDKDSLQTSKVSLFTYDNVENINVDFTTKRRKKRKKKKKDYSVRGMAIYLNNFLECPNKKSFTTEICNSKEKSLNECTETENIYSIAKGNTEHVKIDDGNIGYVLDDLNENEESIHTKPTIISSVQMLVPQNSDISSVSYNMDDILKSGSISTIGSEMNIHENDKHCNDSDSLVKIHGGTISLQPNQTGESSAVYNLIQPPQQVGASFTEFQYKLENHLRGCLWSPDGSSILTNSDDNILRIFSIPDDLLYKTKAEELCAYLRMNEGETIYDMGWYPFMDSTNPDTCCFISTSRDHPIHLWDACSGTVRCSYRAHNQLDELVSAHCVTFNIDGSKIYCGFDKCIRIFDSSRPGTECSERSTVARKNQSRKGKHKHTLNQSGIISSIAFSHYCGLYALGSFSKTVGLYDVNDGKPHSLMNGHTGGVTQVKFTDNGYYLISGARKDAEIVWWDLRNTTIPLFKLLREVSTNQRIQFDIDRSGFRVFSGGTDKVVNIWDLKNIFDDIQDDVVCYQPTFQFCAHDDAVNAVCLHPTKPLLASTSGQRHFFVDSDSDSMDTDSPNSRNHFENSLKIWKLIL